MGAGVSDGVGVAVSGSSTVVGVDAGGMGVVVAVADRVTVGDA
jgi:hypothetical protein